MDRVRLSRIIADLGGCLQGADPEIAGAAIDSRTVQTGELFVALAGSRVDGHDYVAVAAAAGAAAALVERVMPVSLPQWIVPDTREALAALGCWVRKCCRETRILAVTGSNGKTTVKEMLAAILMHCGETLATPGNYNNELGVPLTLCRLRRQHHYAVMELGASAPGEIRRLTQWAAPSVGVITNTGRAHLQGFGTVAGVARGKGELFEALPEEGTAVINAEDPFADLWRGLAGDRRCVTYALGREADVRGATAADGRLELHWNGRMLPVRLHLPGRHNQLNALACAAAAWDLGVSEEAIRGGLEAMRPVPGRLCWCEGIGGSRILDDTYNANPASLAAAIRVLAAAPGQRWLVLGDMAELGCKARRLHRHAGRLARAGGIERLFTIGELAAEAAIGFGPGAELFAERSELVKAVSAGLGPDIAVLVKGSRSAAMDLIAARLVAGKPNNTRAEG